ncbi:hypothetical protein FY150_21075 [Agrobacterium tumefaciens]|jgi:hypothetical protein|nr:hypothetical protein FY150_21075 [Agrobacterium tumefaciens]
MAYTAVLEARAIGKKDMEVVREAIKLREERAKIQAKASAAAQTQKKTTE